MAAASTANSKLRRLRSGSAPASNARGPITSNTAEAPPNTVATRTMTSKTRWKDKLQSAPAGQCEVVEARLNSRSRRAGATVDPNDPYSGAKAAGAEPTPSTDASASSTL
jgi:hypothetical protein